MGRITQRFVRPLSVTTARPTSATSTHFLKAFKTTVSSATSPVEPPFTTESTYTEALSEGSGIVYQPDLDQNPAANYTWLWENIEALEQRFNMASQTVTDSIYNAYNQTLQHFDNVSKGLLDIGNDVRNHTVEEWQKIIANQTKKDNNDDIIDYIDYEEETGGRTITTTQVPDTTLQPAVDDDMPMSQDTMVAGGTALLVFLIILCIFIYCMCRLARRRRQYNNLDYIQRANDAWFTYLWRQYNPVETNDILNAGGETQADPEGGRNTPPTDNMTDVPLHTGGQQTGSGQASTEQDRVYADGGASPNVTRKPDTPLLTKTAFSIASLIFKAAIWSEHLLQMSVFHTSLEKEEMECIRLMQRAQLFSRLMTCGHRLQQLYLQYNFEATRNLFHLDDGPVDKNSLLMLEQQIIFNKDQILNFAMVYLKDHQEDFEELFHDASKRPHLEEELRDWQNHICNRERQYAYSQMLNPKERGLLRKQMRRTHALTTKPHCLRKRVTAFTETPQEQELKTMSGGVVFSSSDEDTSVV